MKVSRVDNLFCAGEKSGFFVGHTEAIATGTLAGYNAVRCALEMPLLILPTDTVIGNIISYVNYKMSTEEGRKNRYTFAGVEYFKRMQENNMYTLDKEEIANRIKRENLYNIFIEKLV